MTPDSSARVRLLREDETIRLPEGLACSAGFAGLDPWLSFVHRTYRFPVYRWVSETANTIDGWLALVRVKHFLFGDYLTTSPFGSYGGFAYSSLAGRQGLLEKARQLGKDLGVEYVNVRFAAADLPPEGWTQHPVYATYLIDLESPPDTLMKRYSSDHRNHIRKSQRKGFSIKFGRLELLDDVYEALARSMHELGSPYHDKAYLRRMAESLGEALEFTVLYAPRGELAGAGVFIFQENQVTNLHANILRHFRSEYAGEFLYWSALERYSRRGCKTFDLGRSLIGSGNETFKMKWKPRRKQLAYWYSLMPGHPLPELNQKNPRFQLAISVWRRLPGLLVRRLGPFLIRGLA